MRRLLLLSLVGWPALVVASAPASDFAPRCTAAMQAALPQRPSAEVEAHCRCTERSARAAGVSRLELIDFATALERDPRAVAPPPIRAAAAGCLQEAIRRVNEEAREEFQRTSDARNRADANVGYRWTAWLRTSGGMEEMKPPDDAWPVEIGGVTCELGPVLTREHRDGAVWKRDVFRTLDCPGAQVAMKGTRILPDHTGCSHSRDGEIGIEGGANFEVRPREGEPPVGTLMLRCDRTDR